MPHPIQIGTGSGRQRRDAGGVDHLRRAGVVDARLGPEPAQQRDLLLHARRTATEVDPERLVLDVVPPDAHAETDAARREERERGDLLGHQRGLALRQHQDIGHQLEPARAREVGEQDQRLEERVPGVVVPGPSRPGA